MSAKDVVIYFLIVVVIFECLYLAVLRRPAQKVLSLSVSPSPSATILPTPSPISTPTPTDSPTPTPKPTPTPIPQPKFTSQEINGFIDRFAGQYGVDPNVLRALAICESSFNPSAKNWIYVGLFQFGPVTWKNLRVEIGEDPNINLRYNAEEATQTAAYAVSRGKRGIWPNCNP